MFSLTVSIGLNKPFNLIYRIEKTGITNVSEDCYHASNENLIFQL